MFASIYRSTSMRCSSRVLLSSSLSIRRSCNPSFRTFASRPSTKKTSSRKNNNSSRKKSRSSGSISDNSKNTSVSNQMSEDITLENILNSNAEGGIVVPEKTGPRAFNIDDYDYEDVGRVISANEIQETEAAVDELFKELLSRPPDYEQRLHDDREDLLVLPHDPEEFFLTRSKTTANYVLLLRVHNAKSLVYEGLRVYENAVRQGNLTPSLPLYSILISLCGSQSNVALKTISASPSRFQKEATKALEIFDELRSNGFTPDVYVYGSLIATMSKLGHMAQAFRVFEMMKYQRLIPDKRVYTSLIVGCYKTLQFEKAEEMFREMRINGQEPDVPAYNMMMRIEAKKETPEGAIAYMTELEHFGHTPDIQSFTLCIYSCAKRPDFYEKAFELYDMAMARGYHPNKQMLNSLIFVTSNMGDIETARLLFDQFQLYKLSRDEITYATMLRTIGKKIRQDFYINHDGSQLDRMKRIELAQAYFDEYLETGATPSRRMLNTMLSVYTKGFRMAQAEEFRNIVFPKNGHQCDYYSYLSLISMYYRIKALDKCYDTLQEMKSVGLKPDYDIYMLVLRACKYRKSDFLGAKVLKEMYDNNIVADEDVAYPFQEIVESLPDYKPPTSIEPARAFPLNPAITTRDEKMIEQAKFQRQLMLQSPESLSLLERVRKTIHNDYNTHDFHPSNPEFVRNFVNRERDRWTKLEKPTKWPRAKIYQQGLLTDNDPDAKLVGEKILNFHMKEIQGQYIAEGADKVKPLQLIKNIRVPAPKNPPLNDL